MDMLSNILNTFVGLFVIVDPFAVLPVYLTMTNRFNTAEKNGTINKAVCVGTLILIIFALSGTAIFRVFGITMGAFQIAGGILLLLFGIAQLNQKRERVGEQEEEEMLAREDVSIFPLATPLIAGPGAISTVILYSSHGQNALDAASLLIAIALVAASMWVLLRTAPYVHKVLGATGLNVITRIMGLILTAIAVQFIVNGLKAVIPQITGG